MNDIAETVLRIMSAIPSGHVLTYGDIAERAGTGPRAVGQILRSGGHDGPWWRVVNASGQPVKSLAREALAQFLEEATPLLRDDETDVRVDLALATWRRSDTTRRA
ncbi:MGMT family protein [Microbacterium sp. TPD7012]|uniref:MGMT family protein n=1 Tax=Microbacterium sp. TPD7012 TaxID=2171975 RepID=UPI000D51F47D|nr:MGMT family protein [Microbacterium sp. TPD7012]PVE96929.1 hypothetical protein DC434_05905 [Microbacterium sp. TPD7012]